MDVRSRRRTIVGAGLAALAGATGGGYAWRQYDRRNHLRIWHLEVVNESADPVTLETVVERDGETLRNETSLAPAGDERGDDRTQLFDRWMKHAAEWDVRAERGDRRLELSAGEITDRLEGSGWGTDCAHVVVVVTASGDLEGRVKPSTSC